MEHKNPSVYGELNDADYLANQAYKLNIDI